MKIGIIGMGRAGQRYHAIASAEGHQVIGYDVRDELSCGLPVGEVYNVSDAVVIATPPAHHITDIMLAHAHDTPALVEKPLLDKVAWLPEAQVMPVTTYRFHPHVWLARFENPDAAEVRVRYRDHLANWQAESYERDGDLEARIHFVDLLYWIGGPELAAGHRERVTVDLQTPGERECVLMMDGKPYDLPPSHGAHEVQFRHFTRWLEGKDEPTCTVKDALEVLRICLSP